MPFPLTLCITLGLQSGFSEWGQCHGGYYILPHQSSAGFLVTGELRCLPPERLYQNSMPRSNASFLIQSVLPAYEMSAR